MDELTHIDEKGRAQMVDVGNKPPVRRVAKAQGDFVTQKATLDRLLASDLPKG